MAVLRLSHHRYRHRHPTVDVSTVPECSGYTVRGRSVRHAPSPVDPRLLGAAGVHDFCKKNNAHSVALLSSDAVLVSTKPPTLAPRRS